MGIEYGVYGELIMPFHLDCAMPVLLPAKYLFLETKDEMALVRITVTKHAR